MARDYTRAEVLDIIDREAQERGIPREDFLRFAYIETGGKFDEQASRGEAGAKGLFQFVPATAEHYGIRGRELDAVANTDAAAQLYQDNRRVLVNRHDSNGMPYLSGKDQPDGLDMYLAHQQGATGYRSIQTAIATGEFERAGTKANILNNVSDKDLERITGVAHADFVRMGPQDMARTFSHYWEAKFEQIRIPEKNIGPASVEQRQAAIAQTATPAAAPASTDAVPQPGIALESAYALTRKYDDVKYAMNGKHPGVDGKHPEQGYVDCSGWVGTMQNATMREINEKAGHAVFGKRDMFNLGMDGAAMIVEKASQNSGTLLEGRAVTAAALKEGMIIGEDNGPTKWDGGRFKGIDHITMVVRDPNDGQLKISQSRGGEGVELSSLENYLERKQANGVKLYATDPLAKARDLLQDREQVQSQDKHTAEAPAHDARPATLREKDKGAQVEALQDTLNRLGYRDAQGKPLEADAHFGARTSEALKAFQRAHGLEADGIAGRNTHDALEKATRAPLLSDPANPQNGLFKSGREQLEKQGVPADQLDNAAGKLAQGAAAAGLNRIDHVLPGRDGGMFAVQGELSDPAMRRAFVDREAMQQPIEQSSQQARQAQTQAQDAQQQERVAARAM